jgi:hypothetical protein
VHPATVSTPINTHASSPGTVEIGLKILRLVALSTDIINAIVKYGVHMHSADKADQIKDNTAIP